MLQRLKRLLGFGPDFDEVWQAAPSLDMADVFQQRPLVSIIVPFKNHADLLKLCLDSILSFSQHYPHFELLGINHESTCPETLALMEHYSQADSRIRFMDYHGVFNYSAMNNLAASQARGDVLVLLNNDIELLTPDWLLHLLKHALHPQVGAVGALLYYPNLTVQHAGIALGIFGTCGHLHKGLPQGELGFSQMLKQPRVLSAVTGACLAVRKSLFEKVQGLDAEAFPIGYNDVDFCLRLQAQGYTNVFTPNCEAIHHESVTRTAKHTRAKPTKPTHQVVHEAKEKAIFRARHQALIEDGDPYYPRCRTLLDESMARMPWPAMRGLFRRRFYMRLVGPWCFRLFQHEGAPYPLPYFSYLPKMPPLGSAGSPPPTNSSASTLQQGKQPSAGSSQEKTALTQAPEAKPAAPPTSSSGPNDLSLSL